MKAMTKKAAEETKPEPAERLLLVNTQDKGEIRVRIPAGAFVTFGPAIPAPRRSGDYTNNEREYALRIYDKGSAKGPLLAVFTGVRQFREATIPVEKLVLREAGKSVWKSDEEGYSVQTEVKKKGYAVVPDVGLLNAGPDDEEKPF